ncbi:SLC13 family permease [Edaphovirga cremea]|uniref:SLC13 family permease n=1 Tax=Edaphovirga cremea TaxID=2267246 RepID=UPI000DEFAD01|nr:SLC13 family permease [Edaphovirga cremea]
MFKSTALRICAGILAVIIAIFISQMDPPEGLTPQSMLGLGIFLATVIFWIFEITPDFIAAILMSVCWAAFGAVPFSIAFSAYNTPTFWLTLGAFGLAAAIGKSGLLTRIAKTLMRKFPLTFKGQALGLLLTGLVISPLIPSTTTKSTLMAPFPKAIGEIMGYEKNSRGAGGLFGAMFISAAGMQPVFLSSSFICYAIFALMPESTTAYINWGTWFLNTAIWATAVLVLHYIAIVILYKPEAHTAHSQATSENVLNEKLPPMSRDEKIVISLLLICIVLWVTERMHGINSGIVATVALCILVATNVLDRKSFKSHIVWDALFMLGGVLNLSTVLPYLKVDKWLGNALGPTIVPLMSENVYFFLTVLAVVVYLIRFIIVSQTALVTVFTLIFIPFCGPAGISPWVIGFVTLAACGVWNVKYHSITFLAAQYASAAASEDGEPYVTHGQMMKLSVVYMIVSIVGTLLSIPFWQWTGLITQ